MSKKITNKKEKKMIVEGLIKKFNPDKGTKKDISDFLKENFPGLNQNIEKKIYEIIIKKKLKIDRQLFLALTGNLREHFPEELVKIEREREKFKTVETFSNLTLKGYSKGLLVAKEIKIVDTISTFKNTMTEVYYGVINIKQDGTLILGDWFDDNYYGEVVTFIFSDGTEQTEFCPA